MGTSSNPLLSTIVTLGILIFLYFPHFLLKLVISPLLISTLVLLLSLLRLGASQQIKGVQPPPPSSSLSEESAHFDPTQKEPQVELHCNQHVCDHTSTNNAPDSIRTPHCNMDEAQPSCELDPRECSNKEEEKSKSGPVTDPKSYHAESFVEWDVWAPLEVIYETYEGEENDVENRNEGFIDNHYNGKPGLERYPSLSRYYPESGSDSDSSCSSFDEDSLEIGRWDEEEKEGMFEIALDHGCIEESISSSTIKKFAKEVEVEEDNLIEIDISTTRTKSEFSW